MTDAAWRQAAYDVRFEWGPNGASEVGDPRGVLVVVDVLSFSTSVTVAAERGTWVYPTGLDPHRAAQLAAAEDAVLAVPRREASETHPWTLSPAALGRAAAPRRLVLPSPNGSAIAAASAGVVVAASLRNAGAVGAWLVRSGVGSEKPVAVVAAGERWGDGSLRPCLEDLLGAGAVLAALCEQVRDRAGHALRLSPEAAAAVAAFEGTAAVADAVRGSSSGRELTRAGFGADVDIAVMTGCSAVVPLMVGGSFRPSG